MAMRALVAFLLGYYLGAKDGPERLSKLAQSARDIGNSPEFQALRSNLAALAEQALEQLQQNIAPRGSSATSLGDLWKAISESAEIHELLALLQAVLANVVPPDPERRHAPN
jgi:hypothetical protein